MFSFWPKVVVSVLAYGLAFALVLLALIPSINALYSGHGGLAWFLVPLALPTAAVVLFFFYATANTSQKPRVRKFALVSLALYIPLSLAASFMCTSAIRSSFGLDVSPFAMWALFMSPFGLPFVL